MMVMTMKEIQKQYPSPEAMSTISMTIFLDNVVGVDGSDVATFQVPELRRQVVVHVSLVLFFGSAPRTTTKMSEFVSSSL